MRRIHLGLVLTTPLLVLSFVLVGCGPNYGGKGEGGGGTTTTTGTTKTEGPTGSGPAKAVVAASYDGTVKGKIVWKNLIPEGDLSARTDQYLATLKKADSLHCFATAGANDRKQQEYQVAGGKVGNVFVWLEPVERNSFFAVPAEQVKEYAEGKKNVALKQPHCAFHPRAFVLFPSYKDKDGKVKPTGQVFDIENNAKILHNSKYKSMSGGRNEGDSGSMGPGSKFVPRKPLVPDRAPVRFECNVHNWMRAYAWVFDHPYAAVSSAEEGDEFGTFTIANAPVGVPLKLMAWHEAEGFLETPDQPITLKAGDNPYDIDFAKKK